MKKTILAAFLCGAFIAGCAKEAAPERSPQEIAASLPIEIGTSVASPGSEVRANDAKTNKVQNNRIPAANPIPTKL